ncbi:hypothetical protein GCM10023149_46330 [Mucilaginibacter gynuensis]|uniref:DUF6089 domain-containing protein n=1 Tax=Mucilaginibacter gynuensis TaxID=1302236 RepID=A0ABP8HBI2_9SPHI
MPKFLPFILLICFSLTLKAQTWEIGGGIGGAGYMGDLNQHKPLALSGISLSGFVKRNFNGYLSAKLSLGYGEIGAADSNSNDAQTRIRNLSFTNKLVETSLTGEFNFMHYIPDAGKNKFTPYVFLGVGLTGFSPKTIYNEKEYSLRGFQTENVNYSNRTMVIPYGVGIKYNIMGKFNLIADVGYRYTFTDYLDDVSGVYVDPALLRNDRARTLADRSGEKTGNYVGYAGTQRGDFRSRDTYLFINVSLSFTFVTQRCYYER